MKAVIIFALLACTAFSVDLKNKQSSFVEMSSGLSTHFGALKETEIGQLVMSMVEVHMLTAGPLQQLLDAINNLTKDTKANLDAENLDFAGDTQDHETEVGRLNILISNAKDDINDLTNELNNILYPRKASLEQTIEQAQTNIETTTQAINDGTAQREKEFNDFTQKNAETQAVIEAANEALDLLRGPQNGQVSLAQTRVAQKSLKKVQDKIAQFRHTDFSPLLMALTELAQNFADQKTLNKIIQLIETVRTNAQNFQAKITKEEADAKALWENVTLPGLQSDLASFQATLSQAQSDLKTTNGEIADREGKRSQRKTDLANAEAALETENTRWEERVAAHKRDVERFTREIEALENANQIISSQSFSEYFNENVNQL